MPRAIISRKTTYRYQPGFLRDQSEPQLGNSRVSFSVPVQSNPEAWNVNDVGWREWPTEANTFRRAIASNEGAAFYRSRRLHSPCWIKVNRYLPDSTNVWVQWTAVQLNDRGETLFESESIFDAAGEPGAYAAHKINAGRRSADKLVYQLPYPAPEDWLSVAESQEPAVRVRLSGPQDLSRCDFIGFYLDAPGVANVRVQLQDGERHSVTVANSRVPSQETTPFWPVDGTTT